MFMATANVVWNTSTARNIRDCIRVAKLAKSKEDVNWFVNTFLKKISATCNSNRTRT
jgi:thiazole synthase ThiGH ThiG subunit